MEQSVGPALTWRELGTSIVKYLKENIGKMLFRAGLAGVVAWAINVYLMATRFDGYRVSTDSALTGVGSGISARIWWGVLSTMIFGLFSYGRKVGFRTLLRKILSIPSLIASAFREGPAATALLLWGAAISLAAALIIGPAVAGLLGVGFLLLAPSPLAALLGGFIRRLWIGILQTVGPGPRVQLTDQFMAVLTPSMGAAFGMLVAWQVTDPWVKGLLLAASVVTAYLLVTRKATPTQAAQLLLTVVITGLLWEWMQGVAWADDGGWIECGDCSVSDWLGSPGATQVMTQAAQGGVAAASGAVLGSALGEIVAGLDDGATPEPGPDGGSSPRGDDGDQSPTLGGQDVITEDRPTDDGSDETTEELPPMPEEPPPTGTLDDAEAPPKPSTPPPVPEGWGPDEVGAAGEPTEDDEGV